MAYAGNDTLIVGVLDQVLAVVVEVIAVWDSAGDPPAPRLQVVQGRSRALGQNLTLKLAQNRE